jgi:hypothetical protein
LGNLTPDPLFLLNPFHLSGHSGSKNQLRERLRVTGKCHWSDTNCISPAFRFDYFKIAPLSASSIQPAPASGKLSPIFDRLNLILSASTAVSDGKWNGATRSRGDCIGR